MINRKTLTLLVAIPIVYTLLFGALFSRNVLTEVPVIICNLDDGLDSQALIEDFYDTPDIKVVAVESNADEIVESMLKSQAIGAVVIPKDYSKRINTGTSTTIELIVDNTNRTLGGTVSKAVQSVISTRSALVAVNQRIAVGWNQSQAQSVQLSLSSRMLYNPTTGYIDFFLAALIVHSIQIAIVFTLAPRIVEMKSLFVETPLKKFLKLLAICSTIMITVMTICLSVGLGFFDMVCRGNPTEILMLSSAFIICMTAFAICAGAWINEEYKALMTPLVYVMPSILFANVTWPRTSMDEFSLMLSYIMPIGYAADDLRSLFVKGAAVDWQFHAAILILLGSLFLTLAIIGVKYHAKSSTRNTNSAETAAGADSPARSGECLRSFDWQSLPK